MKSIVNKFEEPMSYYSYKKRNPEIREAIDYNTEFQRFNSWGAKRRTGSFKKATNKTRSESCVRRRNPPTLSLETLAEAKAKYNGISDTIKNAKSELSALGLNKNVTYKSKVQLRGKGESKQL